MNHKRCCIFNYAPHYRRALFNLMESQLDCEFYFGNQLPTSIKKIDYQKLNGFKRELENYNIPNTRFMWQKGIMGLVFKSKYKEYIITGDSTYLSNWIILIFAFLLNKKVYLWMHGDKGKLSGKKRLWNYTFYHLAYRCLLYSDYSRNIMIRNGFEPKKLICIYNSLDYDLQVKVRKKLIQTNIYQNYFKNSYPTLIFIGRLQKNKKIDMIIKAMSLLNKKHKFYNLVLVGDEVEDIRLNTLILKKKLTSQVWRYGSCYDEETIGELIYNAELCVSPGNVGLTAIHCLTYGTPILTHNNFTEQMPEFECIEPDVTGDFFEENNVEHLVEKIEKWGGYIQNQQELIRNACFSKIDNRYNPHNQIRILKEILN